MWCLKKITIILGCFLCCFFIFIFIWSWECVKFSLLNFLFFHVHTWRHLLPGCFSQWRFIWLFALLTRFTERLEDNQPQQVVCRVRCHSDGEEGMDGSHQDVRQRADCQTWVSFPALCQSAPTPAPWSQHAAAWRVGGHCICIIHLYSCMCRKTVAHMKPHPARGYFPYCSISNCWEIFSMNGRCTRVWQPIVLTRWTRRSVWHPCQTRKRSAAPSWGWTHAPRPCVNLVTKHWTTSLLIAGNSGFLTTYEGELSRFPDKTERIPWHHVDK